MIHCTRVTVAETTNVASSSANFSALTYRLMTTLMSGKKQQVLLRLVFCFRKKGSEKFDSSIVARFVVGLHGSIIIIILIVDSFIDLPY